MHLSTFNCSWLTPFLAVCPHQTHLFSVPLAMVTVASDITAEWFHPGAGAAPSYHFILPGGIFQDEFETRIEFGAALKRRSSLAAEEVTRSVFPGNVSPSTFTSPRSTGAVSNTSRIT